MEPGVREHESAQQAVAREEPGVREHESAQRAVARVEPGVRERSLHNKQRHKKMAHEGRKKTINDVLDVMKHVFEKTSRHNERRQGRKRVFENARQDNEHGELLICPIYLLLTYL